MDGWMDGDGNAFLNFSCCFSFFFWFGVLRLNEIVVAMLVSFDFR